MKCLASNVGPAPRSHRDRRPRPSPPRQSPSNGRSARRRLGGLGRRIGAARRQAHHLVVGRGARGLARRIGIVRRPLASGALAKHAAQPQENEDCERQEDDGVDVEHVAHALGLSSGRAWRSAASTALDAAFAAIYLSNHTAGDVPVFTPAHAAQSTPRIRRHVRRSRAARQQPWTLKVSRCHW